MKSTKFWRLMLSEQQLVEKWRKLTPTKQQQVISFVELLEAQSSDFIEIGDRVLPTIEIWSPHNSQAAAQDLLKLLETDPGEDRLTRYRFPTVHRMQQQEKAVVYPISQLP